MKKLGWRSLFSHHVFYVNKSLYVNKTLLSSCMCMYFLKKYTFHLKSSRSEWIIKEILMLLSGDPGERWFSHQTRVSGGQFGHVSMAVTVEGTHVFWWWWWWCMCTRASRDERVYPFSERLRSPLSSWGSAGRSGRRVPAICSSVSVFCWAGWAEVRVQMDPDKRWSHTSDLTQARASLVPLTCLCLLMKLFDVCRTLINWTSGRLTTLHYQTAPIHSRETYAVISGNVSPWTLLLSL